MAPSAVIDYIEDRNLLVNAAAVGGLLRSRLLELQERYAVIGDVRGKGLLQGIELVEDRTTKAPATRYAEKLLEACRNNFILLGRSGLPSNILRISPPLNISNSDVDAFILALAASLEKCRLTIG